MTYVSYSCRVEAGHFQLARRIPNLYNHLARAIEIASGLYFNSAISTGHRVSRSQG